MEEAKAQIDSKAWGRKKNIYWAGDTGDLEIGQDEQDAFDEEEAAKELHDEQLKKLTAADYEDVDDTMMIEDPQAENTFGVRLGGGNASQGKKTSKDALTNSIELLAFKSGFSTVSTIIKSHCLDIHL